MNADHPNHFTQVTQKQAARVLSMFPKSARFVIGTICNSELYYLKGCTLPFMVIDYNRPYSRVFVRKCLIGA